MGKLPNNIWINLWLAVAIAACIFLSFPIGLFNIVLLSGLTYFTSAFFGAILILAGIMAAVFVVVLLALRWGRKP